MQTIKNNEDSDSTSQYILLYSDADSALIGTRNRLINVSLNDLYDNEPENRVINWSDNVKPKCNKKSNVSFEYLAY